ncbi:MAG: hypothetical protein WD449_00810 [Candidatus Babeliales bacterium]
MSKVTTKTITSLRDDIYAETEKSGVTAITSSGRFVGVLITPGKTTGPMAEQMHKMLRNNPHHATRMLTKRAIG